MNSLSCCSIAYYYDSYSFLCLSISLSIFFFFSFFGSSLCCVCALFCANSHFNRNKTDQWRQREREGGRGLEGDSFFFTFVLEYAIKANHGRSEAGAFNNEMDSRFIARFYACVPLNAIFDKQKYMIQWSIHFTLFKCGVHFSNVHRCSLLCSLQNANGIFFRVRAAMDFIPRVARDYIWLTILLTQIELNAQERCALIRIRGDCLNTVDAHTVTDVWSYGFNKRTKRHQLK